MTLSTVVYPAVSVQGLDGLLKAAHFGKAYDGSVAEGAADAEARIANLPSGCAGFTKLVVVGYSQGAQVVGQALTDLPANATGNVVATALFGDPYFNADDDDADYSNYSPDHNGALSIRDRWSNVIAPDVASYCHDGDPICNLSKRLFSLFGQTIYVRDVKHIYTVTHSKGEGLFDEHTNYQPAGDVAAAVDHLASQMGLGSVASSGGPEDVVFVLDSTGSMGGTINAVEANVVSLANTLAATTSSDFRFALVDYKDDPANDSAYQARVDVPFTADTATFAAGVQSVVAQGGGDYPESMYSGIMAALNLPWRAGVKKSVIVLSDAPGKDPEPVTGYSLSSVVDKAFAVDPAQIYSVPVSQDSSTVDFMRAISAQTGGTVTDGSNPATFVSSLQSALAQAGRAPTAVVTTDSTGTTGQAMKISARGTFASEADPVVGYDWNFGTGTPAGSYDATTVGGTTTHTYPSAGTYTVTVRARTRSGLAGLATTSLTVSDPPSAKPAAVVGAIGRVSGTLASITFQPGTGGGAVEYYAVTDASGAVIAAFTPDPSTTAQQLSLPDFPANTTATYALYAVNAAGPSAATAVTVSSAIAPPTAAPDEFATTAGTTLMAPAPGVIAGDSSPVPGDTLTAKLVSGTTHGMLALAADGSFTYTPDSGFTGDDSFQYQSVSTQSGVSSDLATVTVHVQQADSAPQRLSFHSTGSGSLQVEGETSGGRFNRQVVDGAVTTVSGSATVVDQHGNARNVAITSTQNAQGGVTLTLTVDGKTAYSGSGKLKLVGGGILGSFNTAGGSGNSEFGLSIRDKKDA